MFCNYDSWFMIPLPPPNMGETGKKYKDLLTFVFLEVSSWWYVNLLSCIHGAKQSWIFQIRRQVLDWQLYLPVSLINADMPREFS